MTATDTLDRPALAALNAMDARAFVDALGSTFEHSPWIAEAAWAARPFADIDALHAAMMAAVRGAPRELLMRFLCAHPELAGREAQAGTMTDESVGEQASAGLDALSRAELDELRTLNARYRARHGFPFMIAVRRHTKPQIFEQLRLRTGRETPDELTEALAQIATITRIRLAQKVAS